MIDKIEHQIYMVGGTVFYRRRFYSKSPSHRLAYPSPWSMQTTTTLNVARRRSTSKFWNQSRRIQKSERWTLLTETRGREPRWTSPCRVPQQVCPSRWPRWGWHFTSFFWSSSLYLIRSHLLSSPFFPLTGWSSRLGLQGRSRNNASIWLLCGGLRQRRVSTAKLLPCARCRSWRQRQHSCLLQQHLHSRPCREFSGQYAAHFGTRKRLQLSKALDESDFRNLFIRIWKEVVLSLKARW